MMPNAFSEFESFDALGFAKLIQQKTISPLELLEQVIGRIEKWNPELNAVIHKMYDQAKQSIQMGIPSGPFAGVPFLLKDLSAEYGGAPFSMGSCFTKNWVSAQNSEVVNRFLQSGLIILGKTNTPEFGLSPVTEPKLFGASRNPWNLNYSPGGSSGGSAAAVAAGIVPMAHGGDGAGSIRIPAAYCGLFGFKPSRGRTPVGPQFLRSWQGMVVQHVLTRSVRDSAAMLDVLAAPELGAPFLLPKPTAPFLNLLDQPVKKLRIAIIEEPFFSSQVNPEYLSALKEAAKLCENLGHTVELKNFTINKEDVSLAFIIIISGELTATINLLSSAIGHTPRSNELEIATHVLYQAGKHFSAEDFAWAMRILDQVSQQLAQFFQNYDVMATPVVAGPPPLIGQFKPSTRELVLLELLRWLPGRAVLKHFIKILAVRYLAFTPFTPLFNIGGNPAMSVPLFKDQQGLPIGIQFAGNVGDDAMLLQLARQLEQAKPWY